jgi:NAD(P)-dependent dehydrogenase (short-subunit alcohol dehydrogenase family)
LARLSAQDMLETYALKVVGAALWVQEAAPFLAAARDGVVLFSSVAARQGFAMHAAIGSANYRQQVKVKQAIAAMHPLPRLGQPDEVAALAAFLLGSDAGWITGKVFGIDGGRASLRTAKS